MKTICAKERSPHVLRKLVRWQGYIPANLFGEEKDGVVSLKISARETNTMKQAYKEGAHVGIEWEGRSCEAVIKKIHYASSEDEIEEIEMQAV